MTFRIGFIGLLLTAVLAGGGCRKREPAEAVRAKSPKEAATYLEEAFAQAAPEVREGAASAAAAMRRGEYEAAVVGLQVAAAATNVTLDQGLAIHGSMVSLESRLALAAAGGDPNAKRAYELLRAMKRN